MSDKLFGSRIAGGNTAYGRKESDFYPTPPECTHALLDFLDLPAGTKIWEPAAGGGHIVNVLRGRGYEVRATDIQTGTDFLQTEGTEGAEWIITNPPFSLAEEFILKALKYRREEKCYFALLLKANYWNAKKRLALFEHCPPSWILPLTWRPDFLFKERGGGSPLMDVSWMVWGDTIAMYHGKSCSVFMPLAKPEEAE